MNSKIKHGSRSNGRFVGWILFFATLLLLSFGATPYHKIADTALIATRLSLLLILSVLVIRERWNHRQDIVGRQDRSADPGENALQRMRRWYYDDPAEKK